MISTLLKQQIIGWSCLLLFSLSVNSLFANRLQDSLVLVELYNATDGPNWTNTWDLQQPMDTWYGITLTDQGRVRFILLSDNNLVGTIPDLVLPELTSLNLGLNKLEGELPSFGFVPKLEFLNLENNRLTGTLPEFTNLPKLFALILDRNQLSGEVTLSLIHI